MAILYDAMGNVAGEYETEEERLAREKAEREAAQAQVQKQEVITRADGTQTVKTTQEVPAPVRPPMAAQPAPVAAPVTPDQVFNRMIQAESGGQQFNRQGGILTSPKGAQGIAQIMPATARNPGFGVAPATPEELATPEGNRAFGERYFQGLLKHFNGDVAKATAAYNAGPGAVQKNVQANQGQMNVAQLPRETQGYLGKVLGPVLNAVIPSAQASTLPQPQAGAGRGGAGMPMAQPGPGVAVATGNGVLGTMTTEAPATPPPAPAAETPAGPGGLRIPSFASGVPTPPPAPDTAAQIERYQSIQDNPLELLKLRSDETAAPWMRERAGKRAAELLRQEEDKRAAEERAQALAAQAAAGDPKASREMARELQNKEGSWVKMILLSYLSPQLAGEEAVKLGFFNTERTVRDAEGNVGMVTYRADGKPLKGIKADGTAMSQRELMVYTAGGTLGKGASLSAEVYVDKNTGQRYRSGYDSAGNAAMVNVQGGAAFKGNPRDLELQGIRTAQAKADIGLISDLKKKRGTDVLGALSEYESSKGPLSESQRAEFLNLYGFAQAQPSGALPTGTGTTPTGTGTTPTGTGTTPTGPVPPTGTTPTGPVPPTPPAADLAQPLGQIKREGELNTEARKAVIKSNQEFTDTLNKTRQSGVAQSATISRLQSAIDKNPSFWGIDTNSTAWRAYVDINSKDADRAEALNTLARNLNIPREKRAEFDQVMNDYRNLQVNAVTSSGLTASQTNTERESQRVIGTVGSLSDKPAAAKATLEYAKAKIEYVEAKARAWAEARKKPGADYADFELEFDRTQGEKIFADANKRMSAIIGGQPAGGASTSTGTGRTSSGNTFRRVQ